jgi:dTDP-4-dehydrorhamnose 3,5-epimerase
VIAGVVIQPLFRIADERGQVMHMLRASDPHFQGFGEIYFSMVYPGAVKGWHLHTRMVLNYAVPVGRIRLALYDAREDSKTRGEIQELVLGTDSYQLVQVPAGVWNGFKGLGAQPSLVANCASIEHDPGEIRRMDPHRNDVIRYDWGSRDG